MHAALIVPYPLGGQNGYHRQALAQAQSNSVALANSNYSRAGLGPLGSLAATYAAAYQNAVLTEPIPDAGICAGEIIGYRAWIWNGSRLRSMVAGHYCWTPQAFQKSDEIKWGGFHAFKTLPRAMREYGTASYEGPIVYGTIAMWGEVIEHEEGYRSEYAAVDSIIGAFDYGREIKHRWFKRRSNLVEEIRKLYVDQPVNSSVT